MSTRRPVSGALLGLTTLIAGFGVVTATPPARAMEPSDPLGCGEATVTHDLPSGSSWRMCARIHPMKGLILESVEFRPATGEREYDGYQRVIDELYLAQLNVPYDTGDHYFNDITSYGFGDEALVPQDSTLCTGDIVEVPQSFIRLGRLVERNTPGICIEQVDNGLGARSAAGPRNTHTQRRRALRISSMSKVGWYEYQQTVTLDDYGTIDVALGATGDLAPHTTFFPTDPSLGWPLGGEAGYHAASHWHNALYRVDFGIGNGMEQLVEQWDHEADGMRRSTVIRGRPTHKEVAFSSTQGTDHSETTWWRVLSPGSLNADGKPRSYEIVNSSLHDRFQPLTRPAISFTNNHACQEYASMNLNPECPGQSVLDYVANETEPLTDPVAWVNVGFHHVPRNEDQSPMPLHWQGFSLVPRDFLAQQATTPLARSCFNGLTSGETSPCIATNYGKPQIHATSHPITEGTILTSDPGLWDHSRTSWDFSYLWHRDGRPITGVDEHGLPTAATGDRYVVTRADLGHELTAHVTASSPGFHAATVISEPVRVPGPPTVSTDAPSPQVNPPTPLTRTKVKIKVRPARGAKGRPRARIKVVSKRGRPTGRVKVWRGSKRIAARTLRNGKVKLRLPKPRGRAGYRIKVRYLGDAQHAPSRSRARVRAR